MDDINSSLLHKEHTASFRAAEGVRNISINWADYSFFLFLVNYSNGSNNWGVSGWCGKQLLAEGRVIAVSGENMRVNCFSSSVLRLDKATFNGQDLTNLCAFYIWAW